MSLCIGTHQIDLPADAKAEITSTYAGLRDIDKGAARKDDVVAVLQARAGNAGSTRSPRSERAAELYRAAGANPDNAFSNSRLVGFDSRGETTVIAEHSGPSAAFTIEAHQVRDGRHYLFVGKSSQASRYAAVRDGVLDAVSRYQPKAARAVIPADAFCTKNGYFRVKDGRDVAGDAQLSVTFADLPGVSFSLNLYGLVDLGKEPAFAERAARDLAELSRLGGVVNRLHSGTRRYAGQVGEIIAIGVPSEDHRVGYDYKYFWHAEGRPRDAYTPEIEVELIVDGASEVEQAKLDALWEKLMGSLRLRGEHRSGTRKQIAKAAT